MSDQRQFRNALGQFPTGVAIVTTLARDGAPIGVTVNSFSSVSLDPAMILWSLDKRAFSLPAFQAAPRFAVHILSEHQEALSNRFARASDEKFSQLELCRGLGGVPLLTDCAAIFECTTAHLYDGGDHLIIVGRVERFATEDRQPLLFHRGRYARLAGDACLQAA